MRRFNTSSIPEQKIMGKEGYVVMLSEFRYEGIMK